ncbi:MAG: GH116 family glycosyl hydrolase [Opitutaceae bacterium]
MHHSQLPRSGMALGGIGTGSFEIRQDGGFYNWSIFNNAPLFAGPRFPHGGKQLLFFKLWLRVAGENPRMVLLQIEDGDHPASFELDSLHYLFPWLTGMDVIRTTASFPFSDLEFEQHGLPLRLTMRAWSPFVPGDVDASSLPLAWFDIEVRSISDRAVDVQILGVLRNVVAYDQTSRVYVNRRVRDADFSAVVCEAGQTDSTNSTTGSMCLACFSETSTAYMGWEHLHPYYERALIEYPLPECDDTAGRNGHDKATGALRADPRCFVTIGDHATLEKHGATLRRTFALSWHFPNNYAKQPNGVLAGYLEDEPFPGNAPVEASGAKSSAAGRMLESHRYAARFDSAEAVARHAKTERARLLADTEAFHRVFFDSSLPGFVLDQVNSQLNTLRSSTWLTRTGMFGVMEGLTPDRSFAGIATVDVAMYGQIAISLLFPALDRQTADIWTKFQNPNGSIIHSVSCNSEVPCPGELNGHRLDLPGQYAFMVLRCALWSGDEAYLEKTWPHVKSALAYVLRERDRNGDKLPDMEGIMCSYDNFPMFGVSPYVVTQWLAAVSLALVAARKLGDASFISEYTPCYEQGIATLERTAWNGDYFNLSSEPDSKDPVGRIGCLTDQIIGDGLAHHLGLPPLVAPDKASRALDAILRLNYKPDQGLRNCQWPTDEFLHPVHKDCWVDQANTCWTGVEFNFAAHLYHVGRHEQAEEIVRNIDTRYRKWGLYWDHQEFGGHYFRPLSALALPNAFIGLSYDGETLRIAPSRPLPVGRWCVLLPGAYGTLRRTANEAILELRYGNITPARIEILITGDITVTGFAANYSAKLIEGGVVFELFDTVRAWGFSF